MLARCGARTVASAQGSVYFREPQSAGYLIRGPPCRYRHQRCRSGTLWSRARSSRMHYASYPVLVHPPRDFAWTSSAAYKRCGTDLLAGLRYGEPLCAGPSKLAARHKVPAAASKREARSTDGGVFAGKKVLRAGCAIQAGSREHLLGHSERSMSFCGPYRGDKHRASAGDWTDFRRRHDLPARPVQSRIQVGDGACARNKKRAPRLGAFQPGATILTGLQRAAGPSAHGYACGAASPGSKCGAPR